MTTYSVSGTPRGRELMPAQTIVEGLSTRTAADKAAEAAITQGWSHITIAEHDDLSECSLCGRRHAPGAGTPGYSCDPT
jgi:hypothetical protein